MLTLKEGEKLVSIARNAILAELERKDIPEYDLKVKGKKFQEKSGVFVSLHLDNDLRGCIGFPNPIMPLYKAVIEAAKAAAFEDPRFLPLTPDEMKKVNIEITVLTKPKMIENKEQKKPADIIKEIELGKDGLILEYSGFSGILLPQVPINEHWTTEQFLENLCLKAGVSKKSWENKTCRLFKFQAQIFSEENGNVKEINLI